MTPIDPRLQLDRITFEWEICRPRTLSCIPQTNTAKKAGRERYPGQEAPEPATPCGACACGRTRARQGLKVGRRADTRNFSARATLRGRRFRFDDTAGRECGFSPAGAEHAGGC